MTASETVTVSPTVRWHTKILSLGLALAALLLVGLVRSPSASAGTLQDSAVSWAAGQAATGTTAWDGLCLQFVHDAYSQAGYDISPLAGDTYSALTYWNTYGGAKYGDTNPPAGALVFWGATASNEYGHVALAEGNGHAYSSEERSYTGVHDLTIAYRNEQGYPYLGYVLVG